MSDDEINREGTKATPTRVMGTGKELLGWLKPGSSASSSEEQSTGESTNTLDRRTYMLLAGGAAATAVGGTATGNVVSASGATISQPDVYGYGGSSLEPSGQETSLLGVDSFSETVTQTEENAERAEAMEISEGVHVTAHLEAATVDWFAFDAAAGDPITVEYEREHSVGITGLILYGPDGSFKDKLYVGSGSVHTLTEPAAESGEHYLQVIDVTDGAGEYAFTVWLQDDVGGEDDEDADNTEDNVGEGDDDDEKEDSDGQYPYMGMPQTIPGRIQAERFDIGGQDVAYYDSTEENRGGAYRTDEYVDIEESGDSGGRYSIGFVEAGEWLEYTVEVEPGTYELSARVATPLGETDFTVELDGEHLGTITAPDTGDWFDWETVTLGEIDISEGGVSTLRVEFLNAGTNLNWIEFEKDSSEFESEDGQRPYQGTPRTIPGRIQAQDFDEGGQGVAYYDDTEENRTGLYRPDEFVDIEHSGDTTDEYSVGFVSEGEWLEYTLDVEAGMYDFSVRVATDWDDLQFAVSLDDSHVATVDVPNTGGWYDWETVTLEGVEIPSEGASTLRVEFLTGGTNLNWIEFEPNTDENDGSEGNDSSEKLAYGEGPYGGTDI